jgi:hypothetical protein
MHQPYLLNININIKRFQSHNIDIYCKMHILNRELMHLFDPKEWTKQLKTFHGIVRIIYINKHTGLPKLRSTFTREQQEALEHEDRKLSLK